MCGHSIACRYLNISIPLLLRLEHECVDFGGKYGFTKKNF